MNNAQRKISEVMGIMVCITLNSADRQFLQETTLKLPVSPTPTYADPSPLFYIKLSTSTNQESASLWANPCLRILRRSSAVVPAGRVSRQSHPRLIFPLTKTPLLVIDCLSWDASIELPTIEKLLVPLRFEVDFLNRSVGDETWRPCAEARTVWRNSVHAE